MSCCFDYTITAYKHECANSAWIVVRSWRKNDYSLVKVGMLTSSTESGMNKKPFNYGINLSVSMSEKCQATLKLIVQSQSFVSTAIMRAKRASIHIKSSSTIKSSASEFLSLRFELSFSKA